MSQSLDHDAVSVSIHASREIVYGLVADVTRTPEFSPEILSCSWLDGATGPVVGARFSATNKVSQDHPTRNTPVVTVADPGREFAFSRTVPLAGTVVWAYVLEPQGNGTRLTESYTVVKPVSRLGWFLIRHRYGRHDRRDDLRRGMEETLSRISAAAESVQRDPDRG